MNDLPVISVFELVNAFKEVVETALPPCTVEAEISNCRKSPAGHWYLTLKDDQAEIGAVIWRSAAQRMRFEFHDGMKVLATGSLQVYVARGSCQFSISKLIPQGIGELELAFRQLRDKLAAEGLFDADRKRPIPSIPGRIALITSPTGAAVRDMIQVMTRRWPPANIVIVPVRVQGDAAAEEIARALRTVHLIPDVDVVITGRGGGSLEDLWCFNTEKVARAIVACRIPVISAVGHEIDVSIADLVADRRALTPSEAGELVVPSALELRDSLNATAMRMQQVLRRQIQTSRMMLTSFENRGVLQRPMAVIDQRRMMCDDLGNRCVAATERLVDKNRQKIAALAASMNALSPLSVLSRGYSLTQSASGEIVRRPSSLRSGDSIQTRVAGGIIRSTVDWTEDLESAPGA
ncbi:MAG: exodeoxyribonuclease VII large subunit [Planctomycetota bacterium]